MVPAAITYPPELPVSQRREDLLAAIAAHQVVVVAGETGSGKTTQLPKLCLELGRGAEGRMIAHTQPRRIATRTVAQRIADELGVQLGGAVGYSVRFTDRSSRATRIRLLTDGLLLAEMQRDPQLRRYDTVIVDEAHERSLNIDFLLGALHRLLPRRPDLKLIITSATIDPQRFADHFGGAPIVEVSGRTYPVEVRHRDEPDDPIEGIADAVGELLGERHDDVLVFLSGEREIRDTAEVLRGRFKHVDVLPLYARQSAAEQQRVFAAHDAPRVVLATNVAETSLTVPGIRSVVDPGTARISRYSARLKVQQLPIEPISRASADQRKGRCGRTAPGICIRLYPEHDFDQRPEFTDPEILRTSLASVILQMAAAGLGEIEDFPFLDPPDRRQVRDGIRLLQELRALDDERGLTPLGRRLARLPVDPRLGRMVLEAGELGCAEEVIVIAAALSIQDPRERPADQREQADAQHARFADGESDFIAYLNLWRHLHERRRELSGNQFRKRCREEFLHYLRIREWQDLVAQLRRAAKDAGITPNREPAPRDHVHRALLSGLLSHLGLRDAARRDYLGARGARFAIFPGSGVAKKPPAWVMVAELVETSRLWGREAAKIQPQWVEPLAGHLVTRTHEEPRWDAKRAAVVATERVTLYGLPIVARRTVPYARIDPAAARELFIRRGLVEGEWETRHEFRARNRALVEEVEALEERARRRDLLVGDDVLYAFYDERIPPGVVSGAHFDRWWRDLRDERLDFTRELLIRPQAAAELDPRQRPTHWKQGEHVLRLSYRFDPTSAHDGVTVHVPLELLAQLRADGFEWLVPAFRLELVTALLRSLPKELRRGLVPLPDAAARALAAITPRSGPLAKVLARAVGVPAEAFDSAALPAHLRMSFRIEDGERVLAEGHDLGALRAQLAPRLRARLGEATGGLERDGLRDWTIGELPREVSLHGVTAYPALVDQGDGVGVRLLESRAAQARAMRAGTRRLLALASPSPQRHLRLPVGFAGGPDGLLEDVVAAALDKLVDDAGGPAWDEAGFRRLRDHVAGELVDTTTAAVAAVARVLDARRDVQRRLEQPVPEPLRPARLDVARQLGGLVYRGFVSAAGLDRLPDIERYLRAAEQRLERLPAAVAVDADRMRSIAELDQLFRERGRPDEVRWMLEELRVAQFAQGIGVRGQVSAKRIRRALAS